VGRRSPGESGHDAEVGGAVVLDAARRSGLCAATPGVPMQASPSHFVVVVETDRFEWALCLREESGSLKK